MTYGATDASGPPTMEEDGTDGQVPARDSVPNAANATQAAEAPEASPGGTAPSAEHQLDGGVAS
jgi:hypothetical protein